MNQNLESWTGSSPREMQYFEQETDYTCGVACVRMIFSMFMDEVPSEEVLSEELKTNDKIGTHPDKVLEVAAKYGFYAQMGHNSSIEEIENLRQQGFGIMLAISVDVPHFVVYSGNNGNHVFFADPFFGGKVTRTIQKFESEKQIFPFYRWRVKASEFTKYFPDHDFTEVESNKMYIAIKRL